MQTLAGLNLARPSISALRLEAKGRVKRWGATGLLVRRHDKLWLITAWHVLSGRRSDTGEILDEVHAATPLSVVAHFPTAYDIAARVAGEFAVVDDDEAPLWLEHHYFGRKVDVAALEIALPSTASPMTFPLDPIAQPANLRITENLSIIGFPFERTGGAQTALWIRGTVASEPYLDFDGLPCFLVDARSRQSQSGSPVMIYQPAGAMRMSADGQTLEFEDHREEFVGVYSGRISEQSDLGIVWKRNVIADIIDFGLPAQI